MNRITWALQTRSIVIEHDLGLVEHCLEASKGTPEMSPEDMKMAILALRSLAEHQFAIIKTLCDELGEDKEKPFLKRLFNK